MIEFRQVVRALADHEEQRRHVYESASASLAAEADRLRGRADAKR